MSGRGGAWELADLRDEGLDLRIRERTTALAVARELLPSKQVVSRVFARGQLDCDGVALGEGSALTPGAVVSLAFWRDGWTVSGGLCDGKSDGPCAEVLYRDPVLLAANKPAGLLVHGDGTGAPTLTQQVQAALVRQGSRAVAQAVQRLDVDTTGVVLFSLTEEFQPALDALVAGHAMVKRYLAVVERKLPAGPRDGGGWLALDGPIARDRHDARRMRVGRTGKPALTRVQVVARRDGRSLLLAELGTGRRHQIRVHLAHAGCPIVGDALYGGARSPDGLMLHAWQETLIHPLTGERLELCAPVPERFRRLFPAFLG